jgi:hypothetical protein
MRVGCNGQHLEIETAGRLTALGWATTSTPVKGDWGADIIAQVGNERLVVQCKDWGGPVGVSAIQEIAFARTHYQARLAAVVARRGYTKAAKEAARTAKVHLLAFADLHIGGSVLDRTVEGARLIETKLRQRQRDAEAEAERAAAAVWHRFEAAAATRQCSLRICRRIGFVFILGAGCGMLGDLADHNLSLSQLSSLTGSVAVYCAIILLGCLIASGFSAGKAPEPPSVPRKSALRTCPCCELRLRLEVERSGWLMCPRCKWLLHANTMYDQTSQRYQGDAMFEADEQC